MRVGDPEFTRPRTDPKNDRTRGATSPAPWATLLDAVDQHARLTPGKAAFVFLNDGESESDRLTFGQLRDRALGVAGHLATRCPPGERALLLYPPGLDFIVAFLGCLYARVVAVPLYAPHPRRPDARLATVAADCAPRAVLSDAGTLARCAAALDRATGLRHAVRLATDAVAPLPVAPTARPGPGDLAFLQYTSGSTSSPRGVRVTHANLLANERVIRECMGLSAREVFVSWLPTFHDMGLIGDTLQAIYLGCTAVKMPPAAFLQHPRRWLAAGTKYRGTLMGAPNFAFDLCVQRIGPDDRRGFDLSSLTTTYSGSEPVRAETLEAFAAAYEPVGFDRHSLFPCYGLAEATLLAAGGPARRPLATLGVRPDALDRHEVGPAAGEPCRTVVSCGRVPAGAEIVIVNAETFEPCPPHRVGEIWVRGPHVCDGYWNNPEASQRTTGARLADGRGPYLRTGDLGFVRDDELYVTGRLKDLIIVRGRNLYPHDLERTAQTAHPAVAGCTGVAFGVGEPGREAVVIVQEAARTATAAEVDAARRAIRRAVAEAHEVQPQEVVMVRWGTVPKTTSGKVRRGACRAAHLAQELRTLLEIEESGSASASAAQEASLGSEGQ